jgi:hypothetical protein
MLGYTKRVRQNSAVKVLTNRALTVAPLENDSEALVVVGPNGAPVTPTHWSFGQLASRAGAPAGYLRDLPAPIAADCLNYGLHHRRDVEELGVLLTRDEDGTVNLAAATGPNYGRVWNESIISQLVKRFGDGRTGPFKVPGEFGKQVEITKQNTTLYASDRDMFVFLADEENRIEIADRRDGKSGSLARGFFVWNSEVGSQTFGVATFLFDYVCMNRIVWGAKEYREIKLRHTSGAPHRFVEEVQPALQAYAQSSTKSIVDAVAEAKQSEIKDEALDKFLQNRFTKSQVAAIKATALAEEGRPIENLWDVVCATTAYARSIQYQDERVRIEREAGKVMDLVA